MFSEQTATPITYGIKRHLLWETFMKILTNQKRDSAVDIDKHDPFSVLLKSVDERDGDKERADYLIYMTVNPKTKTTEMVSIPRDTEIISKGKMDKINHLYAFGGVQIQTRLIILSTFWSILLLK